MSTKKITRTALATAGLLAWTVVAPTQAASLADLYQLAKDSDPTFKIADGERKAAQARQAQSQANLGFSADFQASYSQQWDKELTDAGNTSGYTVSLNYPLYNPQLRLALQQSEQSVQRSEASYSSMRYELILRVATRYFGVLGAVDDLVFARAAKDALRKQLEQSKQRFDVGLIAITDVQESQAGYDSAVASEISARSALDNAHEALREVIGEYRKDLNTLKQDLPLIGPDPADIERWVEAALKENPQVKVAQIDVELAKRNIELRRLAYYPTVGASASHSYTDQDSPPFTDRHGVNNSIALGLSVPLDIGGKIRAQTQEAQALYAQSLDRLEQQQRAVQRNARDAYLNVLSNISRVKAFKQALLSTETAYRATVTGFEVGTRTSVDVLNARQRLLQAQRDYARSRYNYILETFTLKQAAGLLTEEDLVKVNDWFAEVASDKDSLDLADQEMKDWEAGLEKK